MDHEYTVRTLDEAEEVLNETCQGDEPRFPDRTYEDGLRMMWDWIVGNTDEHPYPPREVEE